MREGIQTEFSRNGYVILEDFFSEEEVAELREAGVKLTENLPEESKRVIFSTTKTQQFQNKNQYFLDSADKISVFFEEGALDENGKLLVEPGIALNKVGHALHWLNPTFKKYTFCEKVKETCFQLGLADPVIVQSMYIYKNPGLGGEVVPHQDSTYLHTEPQRLIGFWIALDDATIGCLWFAPGSHKGGVHRRMIRNPDPNDEELFIFTAQSPTYPTSNFTATPVKKGTCVLIHGEVVHKSAPNKSPNPRHAYTFHVVDLKNSTYSPENWLQLPSGQTFPGVYKN
ncbi:phytanoyl-CoA dioxygenase domain-containing protein 1 [Anabrus simplex]|uniref:phytanoyl-CoA dioxygenase domain-containing protein 1 n=1 Tax=Anabrus simplex TaxID=316456 RepID=UPI0035A3036C